MTEGVVAICLLVVIGVLVVAAMASFSAAKAHRGAEQVCREMSATWAAIGDAQNYMRRGDVAKAERHLEAAAQRILAYRRKQKEAAA